MDIMYHDQKVSEHYEKKDLLMDYSEMPESFNFKQNGLAKKILPTDEICDEINFDEDPIRH